LAASRQAEANFFRPGPRFATGNLFTMNIVLRSSRTTSAQAPAYYNQGWRRGPGERSDLATVLDCNGSEPNSPASSDKRGKFNGNERDRSSQSREGNIRIFISHFPIGLTKQLQQTVPCMFANDGSTEHAASFSRFRTVSAIITP
jgi:hypothetical protein